MQNFRKTLLELEFESNHLIKIKSLNHAVKKIFPSL